MLARRGARRVPWLVLSAVAATAGAAYAAALVPRLTNYNAGDMDLTGLTGFVAAELTAGKVPYVDFATPLGPAGLLLLAAFERLAGGLHLIVELWLIAAGRAALAVLAFVIASTLVTRVSAVLVAVACFALLTGSPRDNAFEVLGQVCVWASLACGAHGWVAAPRARRRLWIAAGTSGALALGFEPRCAVAAAAAWLVTLGVAIRRGHGARSDLSGWALGAALGLGAVGLEVLACGSTPVAFARAALGDGVALAGGPAAFVVAPSRTALFTEAYSSSLLAIAVTVLLAGLLRRPAPEDASLRAGRTAWAACGVIALAFGAALLLLATRDRELPKTAVVIASALAGLGGTGCLLGLFHAAWHARSNADGDTRAVRAGACLLFALLAALLRDPWLFGLRPFLGADVLGAVSLMFLFLAAERAPSFAVAPLLLLLLLAGLFGLKFNRALEASKLVRGGYWAGLYVNHRGVELVHAAERARVLAGRDGTVLVVPEDPQLAGLIGRPRPPLRGRLVFSSHYPARLLAADRAELERRPPQVIAVHPRRSEQWQPWLGAFSPHPAAAALSLYVTGQLLPSRYRFDSSFRTTYGIDQGALDLHVFTP